MSEQLTAARSIAHGLGFTEGPSILPNGDLVVVSITTGDVTVCSQSGTRTLAALGPGSNGTAVDSHGNIYVVHNGGRWAHAGPAWLPHNAGGIYKLTAQGEIVWFNADPISPNDVCFGPDGMLYATDPTRAAHGTDGRIWRIDPSTGAAELLCSVPWFPNGLAFGADGSLYVASTMEQRIYAFTSPTTTMEDPSIAITLQQGYPDGMAFDACGNIVICAISLEAGVPGTLQTWSIQGDLLTTVIPGPLTKYTNIALSDTGEIYITDSDGGGVIRADWPHAGLPLHTPTVPEIGDHDV